MPKRSSHEQEISELEELFTTLTKAEARRLEQSGKISLTQAVDLADAAISKLGNLLRVLTENVFVLNSTSHAIMNELAQNVITRHPKTPALMLLGSRAHGTSTVRKVVLNAQESQSDFDIAVLLGFKPNEHSEKRAAAIDRAIREFLQPHLYDLCDDFCPKKLHAPELLSSHDAEKMLKRHFYDNMTPYIFDMGIKYLYPTYPLEIWEKNFALISQALKEIRKKDPARYAAIIRNIERTMMEETEIKEGYFVHSLTTQRETLATAETASEKLKGLLRQSRTPLLRDALETGTVPKHTILRNF